MSEESIFDTSIIEKKIDCPHCNYEIRIPVIKSRQIGLDQILSDDNTLTRIVKIQQEELMKVFDIITSCHNRANALYNRGLEYHKVLREYADFTGDVQLNKKLEQTEKGDFDKI